MKWISALLAASLLIGSQTVSHAVMFELDVLNTTTFSTLPGVFSTGTNYVETLTTAAPAVVTPTTNLGFGFATMTNPGANVADSFNYTANSGNAAPDNALVEFTLQETTVGVPGGPFLGSPSDFLVEGTISGPVASNTSSSATLTATKILNTTDATSSTATFVIAGNTYLGFNTMVNGKPIFLGFLQSALLSPASNAGGNSLQGIITAPIINVPEPSSVAFLASGMLGGVLMLRRRARRA